MSTIKTVFRRAVAKTPVSVHRIATKKKVSGILEHVMTPQERNECLSSPSVKTALLAEKMKKYPRQTKIMNQKISEVFKNNPNYRNLSDEHKNAIIEDMKFCWCAYGFQIDEYIFFDLEKTNRDPESRHDLVSDAERLAFRFCANDFTNAVYADKASAYEKLKPFYKRGAVVINGEKDRQKFIDFASGKSCFVQKAVSSSRGQGVKLIDLADYGGEAGSYFDSVKDKGKLLLEDVIIQGDQMKQFNPDSVNTCRLSTFYTRDGIEAPFGFFRTGRKGSFIDNCATGGVFATIDTAKGVICSDSCDEFGNRFSVHPDSGIALKGFQLPEWDKAVEMCKEAALLTPDLKYLSWDLAYSAKTGWEIVEVNTSGQFMQQAGTLTGIRKELRELISRMDLLIPYQLEK